MRHRHISNDIRLMIDLIDYADYDFILFLNLCKAFDTVKHNFIFQALEIFGFNSYFCTAIKIMCKNANCPFKMYASISPRFDLNCGVTQGRPVLPCLFLICAQLLSDFIKLSPLKGITIVENKIIISQLADDTTLFLKDASQVSVTIDTIKTFSCASGLCLNISKCELFPLFLTFPVKDSVTYFGIVINKNKDTGCSLNFNPIIGKVQKKIHSWLQRALSLRRRILLTKTEGMSRLTYAALSLDVNKQTSVASDYMLYNFVWRNRIHNVRKSVLMNSHEHGVLNFLSSELSPPLTIFSRYIGLNSFLETWFQFGILFPVICSQNLEPHKNSQILTNKCSFPGI